MERTSIGTIDTPAVYQRLKQAHLNEEAAREIVNIFRDIMDNDRATKSDLEKTKNELELAIEKSKADLARWMAGLMVAQAAVIVALVKLLLLDTTMDIKKKTVLWQSLFFTHFFPQISARIFS